MIDHEIDRIALAMNQLRPDWPVAQLRTLLKDARMVNRPRRDVAVALSWVAAEPGTANPYRVLEAGPWWRAAGIEGAPTSRQPFDPKATCSTCGKSEPDCRRNPHAEHEFVSVDAYRGELGRTGRPSEAVTRIVEDLREQTTHAAPTRAALTEETA